MMQSNHVQRFRRVGVLPALLGAFCAGLAADSAAAQEPAQPPAAVEMPEAAVRVVAIEVEGNRRLEAGVVRGVTGLTVPASLSERDVQNAIRRLMATGQFDDVVVFARGEPATGLTLVFGVEERPIISAMEIRGLQRISARTVRDTLGWAPNQPLDPNRVIRTEQLIRDMLAQAGVQLESVDTVMTPVPNMEGVYRLAFDVREGARLSVAEIEFRGNTALSDRAIRGAMRTQAEGFFWFRPGRFDREVFREDLATRLPQFYGSRGYIDFAVVSDTLIVDPTTGKARLIVEVAEGERYRLGSFAIDGASRFPAEQLERIYTSQRQTVLGLPFGRTEERERGQIFDQTALRSASERVEQMYRNEGYLYAQVEPVVRRVPASTPGEEPTVDVTWAISERSPFYVNRVTIVGNLKTHESVIRDRIMVYPGDVYDEARLIQSYQAISALGFFETPLPTPDIRPNPETGEVDIVFNVTEKQTGSINFGTAFGGYRGNAVSGFLGYTEPNLFGQGKRAELRAEYGWGRTSFQASYTDPSILGGRNSGSVSLFHTDDRYRGFSFTDGRYIRTGGSLQFGLPVPGMRWTRAFAGYSLSHYSYDAFNPEDCATDNIFCQPSALASILSLSVTRDTKNHPLFPTAGTRQSLSVSQTGGLLGGDGDYQKLLGEAQWWVPVAQFGGGIGARPVRTALGLQARVGTIFGDATRFPLERFFVGGTMRGEQLRGYDELEITPIGFVPRGGALATGQRVGDAFVTLSAEYAVRFNDNLSVSLFGDAGNIWSDPRHIDPTRLYRGAGIGVSIVTPFGPLGLDYAYGFDRDEPQWKLHFKLTQ
jgi:outer membrane protein insertion porin family